MATPKPVTYSSSTPAYRKRSGQYLWILLLAAGFRAEVAASARQIEEQCVSVQCFDGSIHPCNFDCGSLVTSNNDSLPNNVYSRLPQLRQRYQEQRLSLLQALQALEDDDVVDIAHGLPKEKTTSSVSELDRAISELILYFEMDTRDFDKWATEIQENRVKVLMLSGQVSVLSRALPGLAEEVATARKEAELVRAQYSVAQRRFEGLCVYSRDTQEDTEKAAIRVFKRLGRPEPRISWAWPGVQPEPLEDVRGRSARIAKPPRGAGAAMAQWPRPDYSNHPTEETVQAKLSELERAGGNLKAAARRFIDRGGNRELLRSRKSLWEAEEQFRELDIQTSSIRNVMSEARRTTEYLRGQYLPVIAREIERLRREAPANLARWVMWRFFDEETAALLKMSGSEDPEAISRLRKVEAEVVAFAGDEFAYIRAIPRAVAHRPQDIARLQELMNERVCTFQEKIGTEAFPLPWGLHVNTCRD